jgi:biopolymer transport protein TolQ
MSTSMSTDIPGASDSMLDPIVLITHASLPVKVTVGVLVAASVWSWLVVVLKSLQLVRLRQLDAAFDASSTAASDPEDFFEIARQHIASPSARIAHSLRRRAARTSVTHLTAIARRLTGEERSRAVTLMTSLGTVGSAAPFVGLFGTVYGIMDAFARIGAQHSASLPVVAPAIGEALFSTALGLVTAIPAVVAYNALDRSIEQYVDGLESSTAEWVALAELRNTTRGLQPDTLAVRARNPAATTPRA